MDEESLRIQQQGLNAKILSTASLAQQTAHNAVMSAGSAVSEAHAAIQMVRQQTELMEKIEEQGKKISGLEKQLVHVKSQSEMYFEALTRTQTDLLEWMHACESFKRLAKKYREELGKSQALYEDQLDAFRIDIAQEDVKYQKTEWYGDAVKRQQSRSR